MDSAVHFTDLMVASAMSDCDGKLATKEELGCLPDKSNEAEYHDAFMMDCSIKMFRSKRNSCIAELKSFVDGKSKEHLK